VLHGGAEKYKGAARLKDALAIKLDQIIPDPNQPRKEFDSQSLEELANSMKSRGQLQPIRVRWDQHVSRWVIIAGERRYRAAAMAGIPTLVCVEATAPQTPEDRLEDQLVENCIRAELRPIEQAHAFKELMDRRGWSYRQLGETLNLSSAHITRVMALLDLPEDLQSKVTAGELAPSVAYEVSRLETPEQQREVAAQVVDEGLNRAEAVEAVKRVAKREQGRGGKPKANGKASKALTRLPAEIRRRCQNGCRVTITTAARHTMADVVADLESLAAELRTEMEGETQGAA
jgi:ParB family chromosome partitioning protein